MKVINASVLAVALMFTIASSIAPAQSAQNNQRADARNMRLVGYSDLQGRSAFLPVIVEQHGRWIAYVRHQGGTAVNSLNGKSEGNGTSILDVTDPKHPKYLHHLATAGGRF
jgi:hypothetical protein